MKSQQRLKSVNSNEDLQLVVEGTYEQHTDEDLVIKEESQSNHDDNTIEKDYNNI